MNKVILLVDDEYPTIEAIRTQSDWKKVGFDRVLTADSVQSAKEQFFRNTIQVLLCDIEMPGETGLDLLQWMRVYSPDTIGIFLTCHADFTYAREAVKMGAFDYLLKPVSIGDIERVTGNALSEWEKRHSSTVRGELWERNKPAVIEHFWWDVLNNLLSDSKERMLKQIGEKKLSIDVEADYLLMSCVIRQWNLDLTVWEKYDLDFVVKNILTELFADEHPSLLSDTVNRKWILFPYDAGRSPDGEVIRKKAGRFMEFMKEHFDTKSSFYMGDPCKIEKLPAMHDMLVRQEQNNVSYDDRIFCLQEDVGPGSGKLEDQKELEEWKVLLLAGKGEELCGHLRRYVRKMVSDGKMDARILLLFYQDVLQMVYSVLTDCNISVKELLMQYDFEENYKEALTSIEKLLEHLERIIQTAVHHIDSVRHEKGVVGEIKKYIDEHLGEEMSRNSLAELVYLNPSYLARLFRNETGYYLVDYITMKKMEKVQKLLLTTDWSVTQIAQELGYTNMPYFSRVFKKETGCTPVEYRKKMQTS